MNSSSTPPFTGELIVAGASASDHATPRRARRTRLWAACSVTLLIGVAATAFHWKEPCRC